MSAEITASAGVQTSPKRLTGKEFFHIRSVLYGPTGVGKTTLAATAPRPFFWMVDPEGWLAIASSGHLWWEVSDLDCMRRAWGWAAANMDQYDTLVVDTLTHLQNIGLDEIIDPSSTVLERKIYAQSTRQIRSVIMGLMTFPKDVIFLCNAREREGSTPSLKVTMPALTPSVCNILMDVVRLVGHLTVARTLEKGRPVFTRTLQVAMDGRIFAKDTSGILPYQIVDPNLTEIFGFMRNSTIKMEDPIVPEVAVVLGEEPDSLEDVEVED